MMSLSLLISFLWFMVVVMALHSYNHCTDRISFQRLVRTNNMIFGILILALRCIIPPLIIIGTAANGWIIITVLKLLSLPFGRGTYHRLDQMILSTVMGMIGFFSENWSRVEYHFYGDPLPKEPESVLYISNHQCTVDWIIAEVLCLKQGGYGGRVHYFMKYGVLYIPLYGWYLATRQNIFLKRNKLNNPNWLKGKLLELQQKEIPIWLAIFPEGTRFDPQKSDKLERSHAYADSLGLPRLNHVLMPRTTGFEVTLATIKDRFQAIYDVTIIYEGRKGYSVRSLPPDMFRFHSGELRRIHIHLERIPISDVPDSEEERKQWLFEQFQKKDKLIDDFLTTGTIAAPKQSLPLPLSYTVPPTLMHGLLLVLAASSNVGRTVWLGAMVVYTLVGYLLIQCNFFQ